MARAVVEVVGPGFRGVDVVLGDAHGLLKEGAGGKVIGGKTINEAGTAVMFVEVKGETGHDFIAALAED